MESSSSPRLWQGRAEEGQPPHSSLAIHLTSPMIAASSGHGTSGQRGWSLTNCQPPSAPLPARLTTSPSSVRSTKMRPSRRRLGSFPRLPAEINQTGSIRDGEQLHGPRDPCLCCADKMDHGKVRSRVSSFPFRQCFEMIPCTRFFLSSKVIRLYKT